MRVTKLDDLIAELIRRDDHPEIVGARSCVTGDRTKGYHARQRVEHADGSESIIMVRRVSGPGIPDAANYTIPTKAL